MNLLSYDVFWLMPCPLCTEKAKGVLSGWQRIDWQQITEGYAIRCIHCNEVVHQEYTNWMEANGKWEKVQGKTAEKRTWWPHSIGARLGVMP